MYEKPDQTHCSYREIFSREMDHSVGPLKRLGKIPGLEQIDHRNRQTLSRTGTLSMDRTS